MGIFDKIKSTLSKGSGKAEPDMSSTIKKADLGQLPPLPEPGATEMPESEQAMPPLEEPQAAKKPAEMEEIQLPPLPEGLQEPEAEKPAPKQVQKPAVKPAPKPVIEHPEVEEPEEDEESEEEEEEEPEEEPKEQGEAKEKSEDKKEKLKPRLFIKVKRYKDLVKKTKDLKLMLDKVNESLNRLEEAKKVEQEKIAECRNIAKRLEDNVKYFKETFTKPSE